jgi:large subunit ribosomal protein L21
MFAIVTIAGKQYNVTPGEKIETNHIDGEVGDTLSFDKVLMMVDGEKTQIGTPTVKGAKVSAKVLTQKKGEKVDVRRYKQKVRYRKHVGFRPLITTLEIVSIG